VVLPRRADTVASKWDAGCVRALLFLWLAAGFPPALPAQPIQITSLPAGAKPMGIALINQNLAPIVPTYAVVANSGDGSLSSYTLGGGPQLATKIQGIPDPHAVIQNCYSTSPYPEVIVTSPSDNSVSFVEFPAPGSPPSIFAIKTVSVGKQPLSVGCFPIFNFSGTGNSWVVVVSNYGDQTVTLIDANSHVVIATVPNVPGTPGLHGIGGTTAAASPVAWIAGTDANLVTLLDVKSGKVLSKIPIDKPISIQGTQVATASAVLSFDPNTLQSTTVLAFPGVQLLNIVTAGYRDIGPQLLGTATFGLVNNAGMTSLALFSGTEMFSLAQVTSPQDMAVDVPVSCTPGFLTCRPQGGHLLTTSSDTNSLIIVTPPPGTAPDFDLGNAAYVGIPLAPGGLGSIFVNTGAAEAFSADPLALPTTLGDVTLRIGGSMILIPSGWTYVPANVVEAALLYVGPAQINFQVPPGIPPGRPVAILKKPDGTTLTGWPQIVASAPGIFSLSGKGFGPGAVLNQDNSVNSADNPAARGSVIQIFATGGGDTTPLLAPGQAAPANGDPLVLMNATPLVLFGTINDQKAVGPGQVLFNGLAPGLPGVWQVNARIPDGITPGPAVLLQLQASPNFLTNLVTIAVQ
jgi:uncharacterized protein (TIGR03437 family)